MAVRLPDEDDLVARVTDVAIAAYAQAIATAVSLIRREIISAIHTEFAGDTVYITKGTRERNEIRNAQIRLDAKPKSEGGNGMSMRAVGKKHHLSKTRVFQILKDG